MIRPSIRSRCSSAAPIRTSWRECARIAADLGYDEINLNVGCPSDRVQEGRFGACLMAEPALVGDCVAAMTAAGGPGHRQMPHRHRRAGPGRGAWRRSRTRSSRRASPRSSCMPARPGLPACRRARTATSRRSTTIASIGSRLAHPTLPIVLNGGVADLDQAAAHLAHVDGVMMGRAAYQEPWRLLAVDPMLFGEACILCDRPRPRPRRSFPISRASSRAARGFTRSPGTCSACFAACRARVRFGGILRREAVKPGADVATFREALSLVLDIDAPSAQTAAA